MLANRVKETTSTTGTGSFTTTGAVSGFQTFNSAFGTNKRFNYWAVNDTNNEWEEGVGYLSASTTLVRERVFRNSAGTTSPISFTTAPTLFCAQTEGSNLITSPCISNVGAKSTVSLHLGMVTTLTVAMTADRAYYIPYLVFWNGPISGFSFNITAAAASSVLRIGVYDIDPDTGNPGNLLAETANVDVSTTGTKTATSANNFPPGWYYVGIISDGAPTIRSNRGSYGGMNTPCGSNANRQTIAYLYEAITPGWSTMPSSPSPSNTVDTTNNTPAIFMDVV